MLKTRICDLFKIKYPIIQGGMQWVSNSELVAGVSNAGGLGIMTSSNFDSKEAIRQEIKRIRTLTSKPFAVNISTSSAPEIQQMSLEAIVEEGIEIVETSGGNPVSLIPRLKQYGVKVFHKIPNAIFAKKLEEFGSDAVAVVGTQAGGHPGPFGISTEIVLHGVLDIVKIPVIVGGGIVDGRGLLSALAYGAEGVLLGTRFLATKECAINQKIKEWIVRASPTDTLLLARDNPNRVAKTKTAYEILGKEASGLPLAEVHKMMLSKKGGDSWASENMDNYLYSVGQAIGLITEIISAEAVINNMVTEATELNARLSTLFCRQT